MKQGIIFYLAFTLCASYADAQDSTTQTNAKVKAPKAISLTKADRMFADQHYREALNAYYLRYKQAPTDLNAGYKIGLCYHYLLTRPDLCVNFFSNSAPASSEHYNFYQNKPSVTSVDAWYFLGKSLLNQNQVDSAIKYLVYYQQKTDGKDRLDVTRQLKMCVNNQELTQQVRPVGIHNLQEPLNSNYAECNPVVSIDNQWMFFSSRRPDQKQESVMSDNDIFISKATGADSWGTPVPFAFNTPDDDEPLFISTDGKKLYIRRIGKHGGDIYVSEKTDVDWGKPVKVPSVNSSSDEKGFSMSADGETIVVSSNRPGGQGGYDLYIAKGKNGKWGKLKNMGKTINSPLDEIYPFIHPTEKKIYFSSNGNIKYGMGGFDLFFTQQDSAGSWSEPFTQGYPINKGGNELCYYATADGKRYYSAVNRAGDLDIFEITSGTEDENKQDKATVESVTDATVAPAANQELAVVQLMEVEKEKIVEKEKDVEVEKLETVEKDVDKTVGTINIEDTGKVDKLVAIQEKEVQVETIVEKEVPAGSMRGGDSASSQPDNESLAETEKRKIIDSIKTIYNIKMNQQRTTVFKTFYFGFNKDDLTLSKNELDALVNYLNEHKDANIEVVGHTDNMGEWETNFWISRVRAKMVYDYLVSKNISKSRIIFNGKGSTMPMASNQTREGRAKNRRVEIILIE